MVTHPLALVIIWPARYGHSTRHSIHNYAKASAWTRRAQCVTSGREATRTWSVPIGSNERTLNKQMKSEGINHFLLAFEPGPGFSSRPFARACFCTARKRYCLSACCLRIHMTQMVGLVRSTPKTRTMKSRQTTNARCRTATQTSHSSASCELFILILVRRRGCCYFCCSFDFQATYKRPRKKQEFLTCWRRRRNEIEFKSQ